MPHFRQLSDIQQLMIQKELIRNIGVIAHIDHGKTTLADALLAGTGFLSPQIAGHAKVLDYLSEEQKRKITLKTANISLPFKFMDKKFLVNLVDTPGHVDFTGKVTRALRATDGVVVVVDVVEGVMAQTEIVTRLALAENLRPVLFINKIDRLITELKFSSKQIELAFQELISNFNILIDLYADKQFKDSWKIDPKKNNVVFGSALHGWGLTLDQAKQMNLKFSDIISSYKNNEHGKLKQLLPIHKAIFNLVVNTLPNPRIAQSYRLKKLSELKPNSKIGKAFFECRDEGPIVLCVTHVKQDPTLGTIISGRLFSGILRKGDKLNIANSAKNVEVSNVFVDMGSFRAEVNQVLAGNILSASVSDMVESGDTLISAGYENNFIPLKRITYFSEPVITVAIETKNPQDLSLLYDLLKKMAVEDPNLSTSIDSETGEYLLSGMGELHLEITLNQLKEIVDNLELIISPPRVVYREGITQRGVKATALSPNHHNSFTVIVEPLQAKTSSPKILGFKKGKVIKSLDLNNNLLVDFTLPFQTYLSSISQHLIRGFEYACKSGPLCSEPVKNLCVNLVDMNLSGNRDQLNENELTSGFAKAIFASFLTAKPVLFEPIYKTVLSVPIELVGDCQRILSARRTKIFSFENKGFITLISGFLPVSESFGLSKELRSATSGRAFWQSTFETWQQIPEKLSQKIIIQIRQRKGLPSKVPSPERFMEPKNVKS